MGAQRVKLTSEMQYIQEALRTGRATLQKFSMKQLRKPDPTFQPRAIHLNMDHVKNLGDILVNLRKVDRDLEPGVIFRDAKQKWLALVDGFHRHEAYRLARLDYFPAYVIDGTKEEAIEYAAMSNQHAMLRRTPDDIKKQLHMLFRISRWWHQPMNAIAAHVGVGATTVRRYKDAYSRENEIPLPEIVVNSRGESCKTRRVKKAAVLAGKALPPLYKGKKGGYSASIFGKRIRLGVDIEDAKLRLVEEVEKARMVTEPDRVGIRWDYVKYHLEDQGLLFNSVHVSSMSFGVNGYVGHGVSYVVVDFDSHKTATRNAVGSVLLLKVHAETGRAVVVCHPDDGPETILDLGRRLGVEFLTPEQLVASIKGDPGQPAPAKGGKK